MFFEDDSVFPEVLNHQMFPEDGNPNSIRHLRTHTEDGIPIRKLYVSNLPPKTNRTELITLFARYGFVNSCWVKMGEKGRNATPTPTYAFVTYVNPLDAYRALQAPYHEKTLRGRKLRISPADSWHQPDDDSDARVNRRPRGQQNVENEGGSEQRPTNNSTENVPAEVPDSNQVEPHTSEATVTNQVDESESNFTVLDVLNRDCLYYILSLVPMKDLIRSERVSKGWQSLIQEYFADAVRVLKTSWLHIDSTALTTAVLRRILQKVGAELTKLHIDHHWSVLNDRTAHSIGKFCPNLEELKVCYVYAKTWTPLSYGCKQLKAVSFISCNKLTDSSLISLVQSDSPLESLNIASNTHVTGSFLKKSKSQKLRSISFYNCCSLQGTVIEASLNTLPAITTLKLDLCPANMWRMIPDIITKLPKLEELSLSKYLSIEFSQNNWNHTKRRFCDALKNLSELKILNLSRNIYITNEMLKQIAASCPKLESLNVASCNSKKPFENSGVGNEGIQAIGNACSLLTRLDVSYLADLSDAGFTSLAKLSNLTTLVARGNSEITSESVSTCIAACHHLQEVDLCGCESVTERVVGAANTTLQAHPPARPLLLRLAGTAAAIEMSDNPNQNTHEMLNVDIHEDLCNRNLLPNFIDHVFELDSNDSMDSLYDQEDFDALFGPDVSDDDDPFLDDDFDEYDEFFAYGACMQAGGIILL